MWIHIVINGTFPNDGFIGFKLLRFIVLYIYIYFCISVDYCSSSSSLLWVTTSSASVDAAGLAPSLFSLVSSSSSPTSLSPSLPALLSYSSSTLLSPSSSWPTWKVPSSSSSSLSAGAACSLACSPSPEFAFVVTFSLKSSSTNYH